ncbi:hypothetical protein BGW36DRAFT_403948 [Talaromyces proteolyticus]|uniref:Uncharacterized protein n=1 Tax=Talaromyces proteolyticus TaxID=1131652 RepID=A0AAD4KZQ9_9EURO|nr:uncharacterized protein BGW36DRAFT_403948 [Talaromyces proteolyticus]KAH8703589.1 hypothetical protein BGW36DRAFT_403948 [Talaromyces proteolyticus]
MPNPFALPPTRVPSQETVDPDSITFEDRQKLRVLQPYEASDRFCRARTGLGIEELVQKAAQTDDLSELEARIVTGGTAWLMDDGDKEMTDIIFWPADVRQTYYAAVEAILTETERQARFNAQQAYKRYSEEKSKAFNKLSDADRNNIKRACRIPWVANLEDRTEKSWDYFRALRNQGKVEPGLRQDTFLFADTPAIQYAKDHCPLPERGYMIAVDASYSVEKLPHYIDGFTGSVRVALTSVLTTFYACLIPRGGFEDELPSSNMRHMQTWDVIYRKSKYDHKDGIYPPTAFLNQEWDLNI